MKKILMQTSFCFIFLTLLLVVLGGSNIVQAHQEGLNVTYESCSNVTNLR